MRTDHREILVIIPAYNEDASIRGVVNGIKSCGPWDILVVNDGSKDDTAGKAREAGAEVLSLPFNCGIGSAISLGLRYALEQDYKAVVRLDADGQHDPFFIDAVLTPVLNNKADIIVGSRFIGDIDDSYKSSILRRIGIFFFAKLISLLIGQPVTDPTSGFNAFSLRAMKLFADYYPSDYPEPEAIVIAKRAGLNFVEVPVRMHNRVDGISSIRYFRTLYYMIKVTLAIGLNYLKPGKKLK